MANPLLVTVDGSADQLSQKPYFPESYSFGWYHMLWLCWMVVHQIKDLPSEMFSFLSNTERSSRYIAPVLME